MMPASYPTQFVSHAVLFCTRQSTLPLKHSENNMPYSSSAAVRSSLGMNFSMSPMVSVVQ